MSYLFLKQIYIVPPMKTLLQLKGPQSFLQYWWQSIFSFTTLKSFIFLP